MAEQEYAIIRGAGEGQTLSSMGVRITFKATSEETDGRYFCMEYVAPPQWSGPPLHLHRRTDEAFYVLEGSLTLRVGEQEIQAQTGSFIHIPRGLVHSFANPGSTPSRYLIFTFPAGMEGYFEGLPALVEQHGYPPPPQVMRQLGHQYDFEPAGSQP